MSLSCRGHGNMQVLEIWCCSSVHLLPSVLWLCNPSLVKLRKTLNSPFIFNFRKLSHHAFLWISFFSSPSLLHLPSYTFFFFSNSFLLLSSSSASSSAASQIHLSFFPPSMWLQPFPHPTSNQPYSAFRWSSDGPQVYFYLSVHEAPFLHLHLPNTTPFTPSPFSTGTKRCRASFSALGSPAISVALYIFLLSANIYIKSVGNWEATWHFIHLGDCFF